jgi:hypothetical protein
MALVNKYIVITTVGDPSEGIRKIAKTCRDWNVIVVGDKKTPADWRYEGVQFLSLQEQRQFDSAFAAQLPLNHYSRKNIGYLKAMRHGAQVIAETDDDNIPGDLFLVTVEQIIKGRPAQKHGWENVYVHFTSDRIWPRGFPLEYITDSQRNKSSLEKECTFDCPIQQYLVNGDPDVDAIYRLTREEDTVFKPNTIVLSNGTYCPFNSQNTIWWPEVYPLLYLPSFVSFRMTDIWRSFVAQICLYSLGKSVAFREATMFQRRNEHSLIRDFKDEIPGYLNNVKIMETLKKLELSSNPNEVGENLMLCYKSLVGAGIMPEDELFLVDLWLKELDEAKTSKLPKKGGNRG